MAFAGDDGVVDAPDGEVGAHGVGVVAAVQMGRVDVDDQPAVFDCVQGGANRHESWRLAPSAAQPMGMSWAPVAIDHVKPHLARSVGLGPVPSPLQGALRSAPVEQTGEADLVGDAGPVTAQRMLIERWWRQQTFDRGEVRVDDPWLECPHPHALICSITTYYHHA